MAGTKLREMPAAGTVLLQKQQVRQQLGLIGNFVFCCSYFSSPSDGSFAVNLRHGRQARRCLCRSLLLPGLGGRCGRHQMILGASANCFLNDVLSFF